MPTRRCLFHDLDAHRHDPGAHHVQAAGGSFGQFLYAPVSQALIATFGWVTAMLALAASALATLPLARLLGGPPAEAPAGAAAAATMTLREQLRIARGDRTIRVLRHGSRVTRTRVPSGSATWAAVMAAGS